MGGVPLEGKYGEECVWDAGAAACYLDGSETPDTPAGSSNTDDVPEEDACSVQTPDKCSNTPEQYCTLNDDTNECQINPNRSADVVLPMFLGSAAALLVLGGIIGGCYWWT